MQHGGEAASNDEVDFSVAEALKNPIDIVHAARYRPFPSRGPDSRRPGVGPPSVHTTTISFSSIRPQIDAGALRFFDSVQGVWHGIQHSPVPTCKASTCAGTGAKESGLAEPTALSTP